MTECSFFSELHFNLNESILTSQPNVTFYFSIAARSDRYHHLETEEEDDTNDEDFNVELRQFSSSSHRFSKVSCVSLSLSSHILV